MSRYKPTYRKISDQQLQATLHNLALGKPIFEVNTDKPQQEVALLEKVS